MNCPKCGAEVFVVDSRPIDGTTIRRRVCNKCHHRFTTYEVEKDQYNLLKKIMEVVRKEDG